MSVCMPTLRCVPGWRLMLDSMEAQTFRDFEYIICDGLYDQRKNEVKKILKDYSFPIIYVKDKPWYHSEEEQMGKRPGPSSARNTALIHAKGSLMVWHDDHTWLPPDWLSRHVKVFEAGFDGMAGMMYGTGDVEVLEKQVPLTKPQPIEGNDPFNYILHGGCRIPCRWVNGMQGYHDEHKLGELTLLRDHRIDPQSCMQPFEVPDWDTEGKTLYYIFPPGWLYSCNCSVRTNYLLKINGFPEEFCGQMGSEDGFLGICLQRAGAKLLLDKKSYVIHVKDKHHLDFYNVLNYKNKEAMLKDGILHFSNEKFVEDLQLKEKNRFHSNPHLDLREMRTQKLKELYG